MSSWKMILVVGGSALALAACGGSADNNATSPPGGGGCSGSSTTTVTAAKTVDIVPDPNTVGAFKPQTVSVTVGQAVEWDWTDPNVSHTVTADDGSFDSGLCSQGTKFAFTFSKAGTFTYKCSIHPGMLGTVTVS